MFTRKASYRIKVPDFNSGVIIKLNFYKFQKTRHLNSKFHLNHMEFWFLPTWFLILAHNLYAIAECQIKLPLIWSKDQLEPHPTWSVFL